MILGAHMSISKGFAQAIYDSVNELDCKAMQIFLKSPRGGKPKPLLPIDIENFQKAYTETNFQYVVGHSSYLLNLAKPLDFKDNWQMDSLIDDFAKLSHLNGQGLVYHVGKHLKLDYQQAEQLLVENLKILLEKASHHKVPLLLENCAGQGTEMGTSLQQIASVLQKVSAGPMLKVCLDSCHAFAAGYDLSDPIQVENFFSEIENTITLKNLACIHLNDSKTPLNARRDRHENFNQGHIGSKGLSKLVETANKLKIPIIIETPLINNSHKTDIDIVKSWTT